MLLLSPQTYTVKNFSNHSGRLLKHPGVFFNWKLLGFPKASLRLLQENVNIVPQAMSMKNSMRGNMYQELFNI